MATEADLAETARLVEELDRRVVTRVADVRDRAPLAAAVEAGVAALGHLDVVVANAGIIPLGSGIPPVAFLDAVSVDLVGVINTVETAFPHLRGRGVDHLHRIHGRDDAGGGRCARYRRVLAREAGRGPLHP